jgi:hypothetical protein
MNLYDVLSPTMVARLLDEGYADNGNWIPAINGIVLPGITQVEDNPSEPASSQIRTDSRKAPDAELRYYGGDAYRLLLHSASDQPDIIAEALGMGSEILDQADTNAARVVGDPTIPFPHDKSEALFGVFLVTGASPNYNIYVPPNTLPHSDYVASSMHCSAYNTTSKIFNMVLTPHIVWSDKFTGEFNLATLPLAAASIFTYDAAESGIVTMAAGDVIAVDFKDPTLDNGDDACIVAFAYKYAQLPSARDYSVTQPLDKPQRVVIDLFRSFGDSPDGPIWERRRFYDARQRRIPAKSTNGTNEAANETVYEFSIRNGKARLGGQDCYYSRDFLLERLSSS